MAEPRRFPWWLLLLLLLLVLLALALWWFWPDEATPVGDEARPVVVEPVDEPIASEPPELAETPSVVEVDRVNVEGSGVAAPGGAVEGDAVVPESGNEPGAQDQGVVPAQDGQADAAQPDSEPPADTGDEANDAQALEPPGPAEEPSPGAPPVPGQGESPVIPDGAADGAAGFMRGSWQSDSGLVDAKTKQKLTQEYTFDDQGKGEAVIRRADGVECRAPAAATTKGGNLQVDELEDLKCTDGSSFSRSRTECTRGPSGSAECVGTDAEGSRFKVDLNRGAQP